MKKWLLLMLFLPIWSMSQFSPGPLMKAHSSLEGTKNCTKCHDLGNKVTDAKCLSCHKELQELINQNRGYHAYKPVKEADCIKCHSDHHGLKFESIRFDQKSFNHNETGYKLKGAHQKVDCRTCHKPDNIASSKYKNRPTTFLGLDSKCKSCHEDKHQNTLGSNCLKCHNEEKFTPATGFDHNRSNFPLTGKHRQVNCIDCHKKTVKNNKDFQVFKGIKHQNCTDCHQDQHQGQFGQNCTKCHSTNSWLSSKLQDNFDHNLTSFPLVGQHAKVDCAQCHKGSDFKTDLAFGKCVDCHSDYHNGELTKPEESYTDCKRCHSVEQPFSFHSFQLEDHEKSDFPLRGAHVATPCFACHTQSENPKWTFNLNSGKCVDCHNNIHAGKISPKFIPDEDCQSCHGVDQWSTVSFDHARTSFLLEGKHKQASCKECHFKNGNQSFNDLGGKCTTCHQDSHDKQFEINGETACSRCHSSFENWKIPTFNHNLTNFPLEGGHQEVSCNKCHKSEDNGTGKQIVRYKLKSYKCIDCHY